MLPGQDRHKVSRSECKNTLFPLSIILIRMIYIWPGQSRPGSVHHVLAEESREKERNGEEMRGEERRGGMLGINIEPVTAVI